MNRSFCKRLIPMILACYLTFSSLAASCESLSATYAFSPTDELTRFSAELLELQTESNFMLSWTEDDKIQFAQLMQSYGFILNPEEWLKDSNATNDSLHAVNSVLETVYGNKLCWSTELWAWRDRLLTACKVLDEPLHVIPDENELTQEQALQVARQAIEMQHPIRDWSNHEYYATYTDEGDGNGPHWNFEFSRTGLTEFSLSVERGKAGYIFYTDSASLESKYESLKTQKGGLFRNWTIEDKAWFSEQLPALCEEELQRSGEVPDFVEPILQHQHGLPDEKSITQNVAVQLAKAALLQTKGVSDEIISKYTISPYFYTDDPNNPQWAFIFYDKTIRMYEVWVDAYLSNAVIK